MAQYGHWSLLRGDQQRQEQWGEVLTSDASSWTHPHDGSGRAAGGRRQKARSATEAFGRSFCSLPPAACSLASRRRDTHRIIGYEAAQVLQLFADTRFVLIGSRLLELPAHFFDRRKSVSASRSFEIVAETLDRLEILYRQASLRFFDLLGLGSNILGDQSCNAFVQPGALLLARTFQARVTANGADQRGLIHRLGHMGRASSGQA